MHFDLRIKVAEILNNSDGRNFFIPRKEKVCQKLFGVLLVCFWSGFYPKWMPPDKIQKRVPSKADQSLVK